MLLHEQYCWPGDFRPGGRFAYLRFQRIAFVQLRCIEGFYRKSHRSFDVDDRGGNSGSSCGAFSGNNGRQAKIIRGERIPDGRWEGLVVRSRLSIKPDSALTPLWRAAANLSLGAYDRSRKALNR